MSRQLETKQKQKHSPTVLESGNLSVTEATLQLGAILGAPDFTSCLHHRKASLAVGCLSPRPTLALTLS